MFILKKIFSLIQAENPKIILLALGDVANHLQADGNSSEAREKVAKGLHRGFHTDENIFIYSI